MEPQGWAGLVAARDPKDAVSRWPLGAAAHRPAQRGQLLAAGLWAPGLRSPGEKFLQSEDLKVFSSPSRAVPGARKSPGKH